MNYNIHIYFLFTSLNKCHSSPALGLVFHLYILYTVSLHASSGFFLYHFFSLFMYNFLCGHKLSILLGLYLELSHMETGLFSAFSALSCFLKQSDSFYCITENNYFIDCYCYYKINMLTYSKNVFPRRIGLYPYTKY